MLPIKHKQYWIFSLSAFGWIVLDLLSKHYVAQSDFVSITIIPNFFYLSLHQNIGIAFGIFFGKWLQIITSTVVLLSLIYFGFSHLAKEKERWFINLGLLGIVVGGAIGNLLNRVQMGYVIDFIVLRPFPVFNIADIGITIGLITLAIVELFKKN